MTVYVLLATDTTEDPEVCRVYEESTVVGVFSDLEAAKAYVDRVTPASSRMWVWRWEQEGHDVWKAWRGLPDGYVIRRCVVDALA